MEVERVYLAAAILSMVSLIAAGVPVPAAETGTVQLDGQEGLVHVPIEDGPEVRDPDASVPLSHTDKDAECFTIVPILGTNQCSDTWDQGPGNFSADWHSTFHDLWTIGQLSLVVEDAEGRVVFQRDCQWFGVTGLCIVQIEDGVPGTWTMTLTASVDATVGSSSTAHGWFDLQETSTGT